MNYQEIKDISLSYSDREDSDLGLRLDGFLFVVEAKINRWLTSNNMEHVQAYTWVSDTITEFTLPIDFSEARILRLVDTLTGKVIKYYELVNPEQIINASVNGSEGSYYSLQNNLLKIYPGFASSQELEMVYIRNLTPLSSTNITNWLSVKYPDCYIMGLLVEICTFAKDYDAVKLYTSRFNEILESIEFKEKVSKHSGVPMRTRQG